ncbi:MULTISPECIES: hypothetical protein [Halomonas]|uniref:hypothetical protein n=1 Tax=Halomonas TaxID=2745 RepID=UPI003CF74C37
MNEEININEVLALDGREISKLTVEQRQMLDLAFLKSRQYDLAIAVTNKATGEDLAKASSCEDADVV